MEQEMTNHTETGARIVGTLRAEAGKGVVRMEDCYETEIEDLWSAVTDPRGWRAGSLKWTVICTSAASSALASPAAGTAPGAWRSANLHGCCWLRSARDRRIRRLSKPDCSLMPTRRGW